MGMGVTHTIYIIFVENLVSAACFAELKKIQRKEKQIIVEKSYTAGEAFGLNFMVICLFQGELIAKKLKTVEKYL